MDVQTVDQQYQQLQSQAQQTVQALQTLGGKLQTASQGGDQQAREWFLDLRELAIAFKSEQDQVASLLTAIHGLVANQQAAQQVAMPQQMPQQQPGGFFPSQNQGYGAPQPQYQGQPQPQGGGMGGGMLGGLLNSGFGRAIEMGAGFGIGDDIINKIF